MSVEHSHKQSQIELWSSLGSPDAWSPPQFALIQQTQAYLVEVFRQHMQAQQTHLKEELLLQIMRNQKHNLLRRNNDYYPPSIDFDKSIQGLLHGSKLFEKDNKTSSWSMNIEKANKWQQSMIHKIRSKHINKHNDNMDYSSEALIHQQQQQQQQYTSVDPAEFLVFEQLDAPHYKNSNNFNEEQKGQHQLNQANEQFEVSPTKENNHHNHNQQLLSKRSSGYLLSRNNSYGNNQPMHLQNTQQPTKTILGKRSQRETLEQFEEVFQKIQGDQGMQGPTNQIEKMTTNANNYNELLEKFGSNKVIGMLHAFILLQPSIRSALCKQETNIIDNVLNSH